MRFAGVALILFGCLGLFIAGIPISPRQAIRDFGRPAHLRRPAIRLAMPPAASGLAILAGTVLWFIAYRKPHA